LPLKVFQWGLETLDPYPSPDGSCHWHRDKSLGAICPGAICLLLVKIEQVLFGKNWNLKKLRQLEVFKRIC
jgi:hypothetical protein